MNTEEIAEILYEVYCQSVGGVAWNGDKLPNWAEFSTDPAKTKQADGWRAVAKRTRGLWPITSGD